MKGNVIKRLEALESRYKDEPLIVLAKTSSGDRIKITMRECVERKDTEFIKVLSGNSLEDVRLYLDAIEQEAKAFFEGKGDCINNE